MTREELLLQKLAEWRPQRDSRETLSIGEPGLGWQLQITADRNDDLGCAAWDIRFIRAEAAAPAPDLRHWADDIARRATGLLEPLAVIEIDALRDQALLRSKEPRRRGGSVQYYEIVLEGTCQASARRFEALPDSGRRTQVPLLLTHEALVKLVLDVTG